MKLIHCADLHLESKLGSSFPVALARERRRELLLTYKRMIAYAAAHGVSAVLIAGDLFDSGKVPQRAVRDVLSEMESHPELTFFYLCGNHDENNLSALSALPENCRTFSDEWTSYPLGEVTISGIEHFDDAAGARLSLPESAYHIVLLHGQIVASGASGNWNINLGALRGKGIDYLALGHLHTRREGRLDERGVWAYSGCLEGRGFDECGEKGFVLLDVREGTASRQFVPFASLTLREVEVALDASLLTPREIEARAREALSAIPAGDMVRLVFSGERNPELSFDPEYFERLFAGGFRFLQCVDRSRLAVFADDYRGDVSLKGEFVRLVRASGLSESRQDKVLECGIRALRGEVEL